MLFCSSHHEQWLRRLETMSDQFNSAVLPQFLPIQQWSQDRGSIGHYPWQGRSDSCQTPGNRLHWTFKQQRFICPDKCAAVGTVAVYIALSGTKLSAAKESSSETCDVSTESSLAASQWDLHFGSLCISSESWTSAKVMWPFTKWLVCFSVETYSHHWVISGSEVRACHRSRTWSVIKWKQHFTKSAVCRVSICTSPCL